jgi:hypothetical protein
MAKKKKPLTNKDILDTSTRDERCFLIGAFYALGCAKESKVDSGLTIRKEFIDMIEWYIKRNILHTDSGEKINIFLNDLYRALEQKIQKDSFGARYIAYLDAKESFEAFGISLEDAL